MAPRGRNRGEDAEVPRAWREPGGHRRDREKPEAAETLDVYVKFTAKAVAFPFRNGLGRFPPRAVAAS